MTGSAVQPHFHAKMVAHTHNEITSCDTGGEPRTNRTQLVKQRIDGDNMETQAEKRPEGCCGANLFAIELTAFITGRDREFKDSPQNKDDTVIAASKCT